jgi:uncharacterized membrane protein
MQNPPPGPPPGQVPPPPPGYPQQPYQQSTTSGVDKKTGSFLAYLLWWITGLVMLFVGKGDPDIKYHAAQSIVFFGAISVIRIVLGIVGDFTLGAAIFAISALIQLFAIIIWIICMVKAWSGGGARFPIPLLGGVITPYAEQLANAVN